MSTQTTKHVQTGEKTQPEARTDFTIESTQIRCFSLHDLFPLKPPQDAESTHARFTDF